MIFLSLTLNKEIIDSVVRSVFLSESSKISFVYFRDSNSFYFFPEHSHSASLLGKDGFLKQCHCKISIVRDELEKLLELSSPVSSAPMIWEIKSNFLQPYKSQVYDDNHRNISEEFLQNLLDASGFFLNSEILFSQNQKNQPVQVEFLYSDEKHFYKIKNKNADTPNESNLKQIRSKLFLGEKNFSKIESLRIGCLGAGGLMNPFILQAAHHGFRDFTVIDHDTLEEHNLNRFLGGKQEYIGEYKTQILKKLLLDFDSSIQVRTAESVFPNQDTEKLLASCDMLVVGVDNDYTRVNAQLLAIALNKPLLDMGSAIFLKDNTSLNPEVDERGGQIRIYTPDEACLVCMGLNLAAVKDFKREEIDITRGYIIGTNLTPPSIITLNSTIASMCLKLLVDFITETGLKTKYIKYNETDLRIFTIISKRNKNCPVCSS